MFNQECHYFLNIIISLVGIQDSCTHHPSKQKTRIYLKLYHSNGRSSIVIRVSLYCVRSWNMHMCMILSTSILLKISTCFCVEGTPIIYTTCIMLNIIRFCEMHNLWFWCIGFSYQVHQYQQRKASQHENFLEKFLNIRSIRSWV